MGGAHGTENASRLSARRRRTNDQVLAVLSRHGAVTRAEVARITGLSRSAVAGAVTSLLADELITEEPPPGSGRSGPGRRPTVICLRQRSGVVLGLDIGHAHVRVAIATTSGEILAESSIALDVDRHPRQALDAAAALADQCLRSVDRTQDGIIGIAAGIPGPVDTRTRVLRAPTILRDWVGLSPEEELARRFGRPVVVANDAQMGATGEAAFGAAQYFDDFIYVKASHGIGAGLMLGGRPYSGSIGISGEVGHTRVPGAEQLCRCGNRGCLETEVSITQVWQQLAFVLAATGRDADLDVPDGLAELMDQPGAARVVADAGRTIGLVLADLVNCLNPSAVIVGGELSAAGEPLTAGIRESINRYAQPASAQAVTVRTTSLDQRAEILGAVARAIEQARAPGWQQQGSPVAAACDRVVERRHGQA